MSRNIECLITNSSTIATDIKLSFISWEWCKIRKKNLLFYILCKNITYEVINRRIKLTDFKFVWCNPRHQYLPHLQPAFWFLSRAHGSVSDVLTIKGNYYFKARSLNWRQFYMIQKRHDQWTEMVCIFRLSDKFWTQRHKTNENWRFLICTVLLTFLFRRSYFYLFREGVFLEEK